MQLTIDDHFNTTGLTGSELNERKQKARTQQERILEYFKSTGLWHSPFEIQRALQFEAHQITSVRRAITNLQKAGLLIKSEEADKMGEHGMRNHAWKIAE